MVAASVVHTMVNPFPVVMAEPGVVAAFVGAEDVPVDVSAGWQVEHVLQKVASEGVPGCLQETCPIVGCYTAG